MHQGLSSSRLWLALVIAAFCLPLFIGLGQTDLQGDEAIYSFAVDRILETGDWLTPRSSPSETAPFLEKPPLKFWLVAAPIRAGLLPHNEFGLRFWDALFGSAAFVYVFAIGLMLAGPVCGVAAVLVLFVHQPLLFEHGLRSNNMEAALLLSYCGGVFHFLQWAEDVGPRSRVHAALTGVYFVLGFMTKFVAALFLPVVVGAATLLVRSYRTRLVNDWRLWTRVTLLSVILIASWFVYGGLRFGAELWETMFAAHVYERFTASLNPAHLEPWSYYIRSAYDVVVLSQSAPLVIAGLPVLLYLTIRRRSGPGTVVLLWLVVPLVAISMGTSKLYHYMYPFVPPLALAAGYLAALVIALGPAPLRRALEFVEDRLAAGIPSIGGLASRSWSRALLAAAFWAALAVALFTIVRGPLRIGIGQFTFRNSGIARAVGGMVAAGVLLRNSGRTSRAVVALLVLGVMPIGAYEATLRRLPTPKHPLRTLRDCVVDVQTREAALPRGMHVDIPDTSLNHPIYYYLRHLQPWTRIDAEAAPVIERDLGEASEWRPVLIQNERYQAMARTRVSAGRERPASPPMATFYDLLLLLPGPYAICSGDATLQRPS